ncbi:serine O-acetyltransferase [Myxococcota bacterium]|nr:serine O-acetyltransferase [Myxococcota bacterium]
MTANRREAVFGDAIAALSEAREDVLSRAHGEGLPELSAVITWIERARSLVLMQRDRSALRSEIPALAERLDELVASTGLTDRPDRDAVVEVFISRLPAIRERLAGDVEAALVGDPAAKSYGEIVTSYPSIKALAVYRIAHELYALEVPILPRMMSEYAHDTTGIDIHPGARIGNRLFIDHGTGVVVGETCEIGDDVRIYQGVTLGAKSPRRGDRMRGVKRHPTIEDDVTIYSGVTILGGDTVIGRGSVIGGNVWLVESVPVDSVVIADSPRQLVRSRGDASDPSQLRWDL